MSLLRGISSCPTCHSPNKLTGVNSQTRLAKNRLLRFDKAKKKQLHRLEKTKLNNVEPKINHRKCKSTISCTVESQQSRLTTIQQKRLPKKLLASRTKKHSQIKTETTEQSYSSKSKPPYRHLNPEVGLPNPHFSITPWQIHTRRAPILWPSAPVRISPVQQVLVRAAPALHPPARANKYFHVQVTRQISLPRELINTKSNRRISTIDAFNRRLQNIKLAEKLLLIKPTPSLCKSEHKRFYSRHRQALELMTHCGGQQIKTTFTVTPSRKGQSRKDSKGSSNQSISHFQ